MKSLSGGIKKLMICLLLVQNTDSIRAVNERRIVEKYNQTGPYYKVDITENDPVNNEEPEEQPSQPETTPDGEPQPSSSPEVTASRSLTPEITAEPTVQPTVEPLRSQLRNPRLFRR